MSCASSESCGDPVPLLRSIQDSLPTGRVSVGWLFAKLEGQGNYLVLLLLGFLGVLPGADTPSGIAIGSLGLAMMAGMQPKLPARIAMHRIRTRPARYAIGRAIDLLVFVEHLFPAAHPGDSFLRPLAPLFLVLLGAAMLVPIPLSNIAPSLAVAMMGLALTEGSSALILAALTGAAVALGLTAWLVNLVVLELCWLG